MYELRYLKPAERYFKKIREKGLQDTFRVALEKISDDPAIGEQKKGDLAGIWCYDVFYNKTNYEIAYRIYDEDGQLVVVIMAGTRENFYEELKRYMK
ncbi:MAG: plasmid stabilization protein [Spirochaetes bacterium GWD1_61_31]|nr:MAG: plasmid stabilization protein [Spirochaetes bacterium GWB1_60_80]OHD32666.1 MAG: plasmid stabilization protein [Spirochaetes bacterium GWC1_61_12]OHD39272.1 MAG: plasmid stabilization protein [Spirochaetes bacterium GWD1_61_31]OHD42094.1 MAG: plasmid stabilization protein [Spirochaetes bacterium GWE1_60_18]OHD60972.1 MAG: plasmid stabilization protein [Spirochaetes bacterium GWF1_60_12]HAP42778.1 plasmid stabilization protein [Spirochaetaceae bacterium]